MKALKIWPGSGLAIPPLGTNPWENRGVDKDFSSRVIITSFTAAKKGRKGGREGEGGRKEGRKEGRKGGREGE